MSVLTKADECQIDTKKCVDEAIKHLSEIVINQCWGSDEYGTVHHRNLRENLWKLIEIREEL